MMRTAVSISLIVAGLAIIGTTVPAGADKSWQISSPSGGKITLVIRDTATQNFRIYDLDFANNGSGFAVTAELSRPSNMSQTLEIEFLNGNMLVHKEYLNIGPERTRATANCPEKFDRIVLQ
jgi:hypothetical protein